MTALTGPNQQLIPDPAQPLKAADDIVVRRYELTLVWPLLLGNSDTESSAGASGAKKLDDLVKSIERAGAWKEVTGPESYYPAPFQARQDYLAEYAEYVYFHPFVRSFLYTNAEEKQEQYRAASVTAREPAPSPTPTTPPAGKARRPGPPAAADAFVPGSTMRVLRRSDLKGLKVTAACGKQQIEKTLRVRRAEMYLFDTGIALILLKLDNANLEKCPVPDAEPWKADARRVFDEEVTSLKLSEVLCLNDVVRRSYVPYFEVRDKLHAGHCVESASWVDSSGKDIPKLGPADTGFGVDSAEQHITYQHDHREPSLLLPWRQLAYPLSQREVNVGSNPELQFSQVIDDRIPIMSFIAVDDPRQISTGDWNRLAFVDDPGDSALMPYAEGFLKDTESFRRCAYDRFYDPLAARDWYLTRYLCSGYGFVVVTKNERGFGMDERTGLLAHFRHHYYKMGLIAHFHHASLLSFKDQLVDETRKHIDPDDADGMEDYSDGVQRIERDFLRFRTRYWFSEISNQVQAQEIFALWSNHLKNRELLSETQEELKLAQEIVSRYSDQQRNELTKRMTVAATAFLVVPSILSILPGLLTLSRVDTRPKWVFLLLFALLSPIPFVLLVVRSSDVIQQWFKGRRKTSRRAPTRAAQKSFWLKTGLVSLVFLGLLGVIFCVGFWLGARTDEKAPVTTLPPATLPSSAPSAEASTTHIGGVILDHSSIIVFPTRFPDRVAHAATQTPQDGAAPPSTQPAEKVVPIPTSAPTTAATRPSDSGGDK